MCNDSGLDSTEINITANIERQRKNYDDIIFDAENERLINVASFDGDYNYNNHIRRKRQGNIFLYTYNSLIGVTPGCQKHSTLGVDYTGNVAENALGVACIKWSLITPVGWITEAVTKLGEPGDHNYCRNYPGGPSPHGVYCFHSLTENPTHCSQVPWCHQTETRNFTCTNWIAGRAYWKWDYEVPATCLSELHNPTSYFQESSVTKRSCWTFQTGQMWKDMDGMRMTISIQLLSSESLLFFSFGLFLNLPSFKRIHNHSLDVT